MSPTHVIAALKGETGLIAMRETPIIEDVPLLHLRIKAMLVDLVQSTKPMVGDTITIREGR